MNIDIRSTESTGSAVRLGQSESVGNRRASAWWNHPALVRIGGIAGVLSPLPLLAAGLSPPLPARTCAERIPVGGHPGRDPDRDVRVGTAGFPPARWPAIVRVAGMATVVALLGIAGFFAALGTEDLLATVAGTSRFLSDNEAITGTGILTGSLLTLIVTLVGLLIIGVAAFRFHLLSRSGRIAALALTPCLILGALSSAAATKRFRASALNATNRRGLGARVQRLSVPARPRTPA